MAPITTERLVKELEKLKTEMDMGRLGHGEYDQRLSRVIQELRERRLEGDREEITAAITDALDRGIITPGVKDHLIKRLGLE
jgi:hypothetical protein